MKRYIKNLFEKKLGIKIFRNTLPRGCDLFHDINRWYGINNFQVVFDVGANIGQSAIQYFSRFPSAEIYSFEPVSSTFEKLKRNTENLSNRVRLVNSAMGSSRGKKEININSDSRVNSIKHNVSTTKEWIVIDTVDSFMENKAIEIVDFVKIDTEGYELEVISGAKNALMEERIGMLFIESEPISTDRSFTAFADLQEAMNSYGYNLFGIYEQQMHWSGEKDILFFNPVFVSQKMSEQDVSPNAYPLRVTA